MKHKNIFDISQSRDDFHNICFHAKRLLETYFWKLNDMETEIFIFRAIS